MKVKFSSEGEGSHIDMLSKYIILGRDDVLKRALEVANEYKLNGRVKNKIDDLDMKTLLEECRPIAETCDRIYITIEEASA